MGRIKKVAGQKHEATLSPFLTDFISHVTTVRFPELPSHLRTFPRIWSWVRGDLYNWISVLNRFDGLLASVIEKYELSNGPQTTPFDRRYLVECYTSEDPKLDLRDIETKLTALGYGPDGDRELLEAVLDFSRLLLEKCGNRSLYNSSERLGELLNTTSLSLLQSTLRLSLSLAQRYHSRHRGGSHLQQSLLATHYNIDLEKLQKIAAPYSRPALHGRAASSPLSTKNKDKSVQTKHDANDLTSLARETDGWDEWGHVNLLYYPSGTAEQQKHASESGPGAPLAHVPSTPTPLRRSHPTTTPRTGRIPSTEESPASVVHTPIGRPDEPPPGGKTLEISNSKIVSTSAEEIILSYSQEVPEDLKFELLNRIRTAKGLVTSQATREQILAIRILAITNLAYIYPEPLFQQKILQYDMELPKRLQITYQLGELVHLGASGDLSVSRTLQTFAIQALDGLAKHKARAIDVCAALSVNVNHGVLMFLTRKAVNELSIENDGDDDGSQDEWRDALLALLRTLPGSSTRTPETLVAAGLIPMFVDVLNLRTDKARRVYSRVMEFLDSFVLAVRDAFGILTNAKGFDALSDLIDFETKSSFENVSRGAGIPDYYKTPSIDYQIPYFQQQTLRWLFRFVNHIMQHNGGGFDRVLRNLIDSPQLLTSLRLVIENACVFGSHVWSNAVNILSSFIHNEPTSYAVIAEAGLSQSFLEAITLISLKAPEPLAAESGQIEPSSSEAGEPATTSTASAGRSDGDGKKPRDYNVARPKDARLAPGIMAATEALSCIPSAFGAICLNGSGLELFQSSHALESFFEIFESPAHIKCLIKDDTNLVRSLGSTFDELVRHHPALKSSIMTAVMVMVARVGFLCRTKAWSYGMGAKLWREDSQGKQIISGEPWQLLKAIGFDATKHGSSNDAATYGVPSINTDASLPNGGKLYMENVDELLPPPDVLLDPKDEDKDGLTTTDYLFPVLRFLGAFFENQSNCTYFVESGGAEFILDLATLQSLPFDFHNTEANQELTVLVHMLAETKPHLVVPSLVSRTERTVDMLEDFWKSSSEQGFFTPLMQLEKEEHGADAVTVDESVKSSASNGTFFAKHMVSALILMDLLREAFSLPLYQSRPTQQTSAFAQVNLADRYTSLVKKLGSLHAACVWEEILLEKNIPDTWDQATKVQPPASERPIDSSGPLAEGVSNLLTPEPRQDGPASASPANPVTPQPSGESPAKIPEAGVAFKNVQALRYLLSSLPSSITGFLHNLGFCLIGKRRIDPYQKQNATMVADVIAGAVIEQLQFRPANASNSPKLKFAYLIVILSSFSHLLFEAVPDRHASHYLSLVLFAFKRKDGLKVLKGVCDLFVHEVNALTPPDSVPDSENDVSARLTSAYGGIKIILSFFAELASGKSIAESAQTQAMTGTDRDRGRPDYFQTGQFIVDLRMEILPIARDMWNSDFATQSTSSVVKCLVDILRSSLEGEHESGAVRRSDPQPVLADVPKKAFPINRDRVTSLQEKGYDSSLVQEALYRCNNVQASAEEYCRAQNFLRVPELAPPPPSDIESARSSTTSAGDGPDDSVSVNPPPFDTNNPFFDPQHLNMIFNRAAEDSRNPDQGQGMPEEITRALTHILSQGHGDDDHNDSPAGNPPESSIARLSNSTDLPDQRPEQQSAKRRELITVEDLDAEREQVRSNLIERCLDVLNEHHDVSFELSDLIASAVKRHLEPENFRREVGELLVQSLVSLQMENFQSSGKKVAAYAHLLALVVQDRDMYNATLIELKECFATFLQFISVPAEKTADETFPWVGHVLLVLEKLLSDDVQPPQIRWTLPDSDNPVGEDDGPAQLEEPLVSNEEKMQLFEALIEILPRIGKDDTLALSVCRILVILTRIRSIAARLGEKRNLQRLFVMVKQLSSSTNEKLQSAFMLILRHIIEDDDTVRQIMRSEIVAHFESKTTRQVDTTNYVRALYHLVLRSPELFVEISNEKIKLPRYESRQRPQVLVLKSEKKTGSDTDTNQTAEAKQDAGEKSGTSQEGKDKGKTTELKPPVVENPDGVIHYLLSELLSYKDVDDKEPPAENPDTSAPDQLETQTDVEMSTDEPAPSVSSTDIQASRNSKKQEKPAFQADDHPIYIYRCFLLQCLTELLSSYNQTKVEFINFSRKADPLTTTPSKPRSGILNYLLNVLVPVGTMDHDESVAFKKRSNTSAWTMRVLVALCTKTGEFGGHGRRRNGQSPNEDDEPELAFVRRFVLEHALRAYKEAHTSTEVLDVKYSRLMSLADLFDKMLSGYAFVSGDTTFPSSTKQLAKTMFEKNFISALTASVSEIDLNFPASKRVIKYILRPLNKLTQTAVILSETSDIPLIGESEEDEISSATSVSDIDDEREETPDLFRHSTLGMLEPRHEEETSSEESEEDDDEMYDDEYGEEMDYEEDLPEDDGEVVSDEEDDIEGMGPIEGLPGDSGMDIEVVIDDDEDDDDDDEDDEDDEDDDQSDIDDEILAGEITGDQDNESLDEGDDDEWESEEMSEDDDEADIMNQLEDELADIRQSGQRDDGQRLDDIFRALNEAAGGVEGLQAESLGDLHDDIVDDDLDENDEDEEIDELEEELEDADEDQGSYHGFDDDEDLIDPWGWEGDEPPLPRGHHHHHHRFRGHNPAWAAVAGIMPNRHGIVPIQPYRLHRTQMPPRGADDGTNPLLVRTDRGSEPPGQRRGAGNEAFTDWVHGMEPVSTGRLLPMDSPVSFMHAIMQAIGQGGPGLGVISRPDGIHVHLERNAILPNRIQDIFGMGRAQAPPPRTRDDPSQAVSFALATTRIRWQEEARILFSSGYGDKSQRIINSLLKILVPPAIEENKQREEERKRQEAERAERERQERQAKEEEEKERKRKEEEEESARQQQEREQQAERQASDVVPEPMDDVQQTNTTTEASATTAQQSQAESGPSEPAQRVHTTIRGRQLDITGMDIDPEYLEALPEELREEVIMQQLAEQRSQAAAAGEEPSEINPEFLEALPAEIREELLQQEAADRRRRERESARRQAGTGATPAHAEEMDPASFLATLDPNLRQAVLADQPEDILASLGPEFVTEARAIGGGRGRLAQFGDISRMDHRHGTEQENDQEPKKQQRRQIVQMLDKAGVATLLRLMFMPLQGNARHQLNDILHNVCENRQNRIEVISLLLSVLQDGSTDVSAIERSFAQLSLRAKPSTVQKTPQSVKRSLGFQSSSNVSNEVTPIMVVQQCLGTLSFLSQYNPHIAWFFLTEHDPASALKLKAFRKGKGKENKANKFALNALLSLLDRKLILESPSCMEQLSSLLASITQPLTLLLRREKEKQAEEDKGKQPERAEGEQTSEPQQTQPTEITEAVESTADTNMVDAPPATESGEMEQPQEKPPTDSKAENTKNENEKHKRRTIEPPVIPNFNLKLVVHVLAARECNGKIFRDALSTINNLSAVPGARDTIGNELVNQAQSLSTTILLDLDELISHIHEARTGTDMQGLALAKFSPASSDQAKLLRVLTALDYLFDPNRADKAKGSDPDGTVKGDVLQTLYESSTFGPLWTRLSECLTIVRQKENMMNVATILLPLVEALMVVCKNTTLKDISITRNSRELSVSSTSGDAGLSMESLFFKFTEEHRKILNELVRQNPRLMSGTFSLLVKNPKVLEFDNKRNYFTRRLHSRGAEPRHPHPPLQLAVRRDQVFLDSFKSLYFKNADELKYGKLNVRFHGEEGVDAGGVTREWFQVLARGMFNPDYALFIPVAADRTTFHPNRLSGVNPEHLMFFKFIGRIIGKALYEGRVLDCHFSRAVYKCILSRNVSIKDMETLDLDYYKSLLWMLENDITDIITETFAVETDDFGEKQVIDLIENGRNIPVTQENKEEYVQKVVDYRLVVSVREQLDNFLKGFHEIIPPELISIFNEQELELLISGLPEIEVDDWKANTEYHNYSASSPQIQWFWRAVRSFDKEERAKLLQFVTGTSKVPLNGFKELEGMNGVSRFNIHRDYGNKDRLPSSHTCFNQLDLPEYDSYETLRQRLYVAMTTGSEYFGFA
ncbi:hypothetical protein BJX63DRAFT_427294 [Aspergillus granulosus]|uniref:HECT-type E3 ubiquitin transferase n=1 Tax=Aspergillus granulosus TaxID=176169 RepID=A0ABR4I2F8_9EURO